METEEHLKQQDSRLDKLERKAFQGTFNENYKTKQDRESEAKKESKGD